MSRCPSRSRRRSRSSIRPPTRSTANDNAANPGTYYNVNLVSNSGATPVLPQALLGNSLTINAENTTVSTDVALPGGAFNVNANGGGNIIVGPQTNANGTTSNAMIDVSGQAIEFVDVLASIGGGNINLNSTSGTISIESGAVLNVGDTADVGDLNKTSAGTLSLSAGLAASPSRREPCKARAPPAPPAVPLSSIPTASTKRPRARRSPTTSWHRCWTPADLQPHGTSAPTRVISP